MQNTIDQSDSPKWLKKLQKNSWEAELLISGGAIFTLVQSPEWIESLGYTLKENYRHPGLDETLISITLAISGLTIGFILHIVLRAYWTALICLNSVYPNGIQVSRLPVSNELKEKSKDYNLTNHIIDMDNWSGLIFFGAVTFFIFSISFLFHLLVTLYISLFIPILFFPLVTMFLIHYMDLFSSGAIFRRGIIGKMFKPVNILNQYLSLSILYRYPLQQLTTNLNRLTLTLYLLAFFILSFLVSYESLKDVLNQKDVFDSHSFQTTKNTEVYWDSWYMNRDNKVIKWAAIQSDIITENHIKLFIPYRSFYDSEIEQTELKTFDSIIKIEMNNVPIDSINWMAYQYPKTNQFGIITYLPIEHLPKGKNIINIKTDKNIFKYKWNRPYIAIPFWKE